MAIFTVAVSLSQTSPSQSKAPSDAATLELPVVMEQKVIAGKTPVGTKVRAKLAVATLLHGVVMPQDALILGEVTESAAKTAAEPCRLALRMDSAEWKNGAASTVLPFTSKLYVTAWYYPLVIALNQSSSSSIPDASQSNSKTATYPGNISNPAIQPFPGNGPQSSAPGSNISTHRVLIKDIESVGNADGSVTLTSKHSNIKLDKSTTYVLAATGLVPAK
jgi:hypothetical protein